MTLTFSFSSFWLSLLFSFPFHLSLYWCPATLKKFELEFIWKKEKREKKERRNVVDLPSFIMHQMIMIIHRIPILVPKFNCHRAESRENWALSIEQCPSRVENWESSKSWYHHQSPITKLHEFQQMYIIQIHIFWVSTIRIEMDWH